MHDALYVINLQTNYGRGDKVTNGTDYGALGIPCNDCGWRSFSIAGFS